MTRQLTIGLVAVIGIFSAAVLTAGFGSEANRHLWDREPSLWEMAQSATVTRPVPASNPQPAGLFPAMQAPAIDVGTRKLKAGLWGPPERLTLSLGKSDVWDRRRAAWEKPLTLAEIREGAFSPRNAGVSGYANYPLPEGGSGERYRSWNAPFPCQKPVGQAILLCPELAGAAGPAAVVRCRDGSARVSLKRQAAALEVTYLPMMTRNVIAVEFKGQGLKGPVSFRLYRHRDTVAAYPGEGNGPIDPPKSGSDGRFFWIRQRLPAEKTFPQGFEYVLMGLAVGEGVRMETVNGQTGLGTAAAITDADRIALEKDLNGFAWRLRPLYDAVNQASGSAATAAFPAGRQDGTVLIAVVTTAEAKDPAAEARRRLSDAKQAGMQALVAENGAWYRALYERRERGRVFGGSTQWTRQQISAIFRSWRLPEILGSFYDRSRRDAEWLTYPDPRAYEADESYDRLEQDTSPWHGLPCYNEIYTTASCVANQSDRLDHYANLVDHWLEACRKSARDVFGLPGMFLAHGYQPPIKADEFAHTISSWEFCMEIPAQVLKPIWDTWDYGGDREYLAARVYPALRDLAEFYAAFVTRGEDGKYHVIPTVSAEHWGWTYRFERNRDSASAIGMIRWTLESAAEASEILARDPDRRADWRRIAGQMAPYPVYQTKEGPVYTDVAGVNPIGYPYNFFAGVTPTLLADQIHLDSDPAEKQTMLRTARLTRGWMNPMVYHLLGAFPEVVKGGLAGVYFKDTQDRPIKTREDMLEAATAEPERLLNSRSGRIHLFACVPDGAEVAFRDFQARGGFLVTAERTKGRTTFLRITARRTIPCRLVNPWPGKPVRIRDEQSHAVVPYKVDATRGECLVFEAGSGHSYLVEAPGSP